MTPGRRVCTTAAWRTAAGWQPDGNIWKPSVQLGGLLGGAVLTETVFAWPGLGRLVVQAVNGRDVPVVLGCIVVLSVGFSIVNLVVDLLYGFIDPRVRSMYQ